MSRSTPATKIIAMRAMCCIAITLVCVQGSSSVAAQTLPEIGTLDWVFTGRTMIDSVESRFEWRGLYLAPLTGMIIGASNTEVIDWRTRHSTYVREIVALDASTGAILHRRPVCTELPSDQWRSVTLYSANDSASLICYTCDSSNPYDTVRFRTFPAMQSIVDTLIGQSNYAALSSSGRYVNLQWRPPGQFSDIPLLYDRTTGDTTWYTTFKVGRLFSSDDRWTLGHNLDDYDGKAGVSYWSVKSMDILRQLEGDSIISIGSTQVDLSYEGHLLLSPATRTVYTLDPLRAVSTFQSGRYYSRFSADGRYVFTDNGEITNGLRLVITVTPSNDPKPIGQVSFKRFDALRNTSDPWQIARQKIRGKLFVYSYSGHIAMFSYDVASSVTVPTTLRQPALYPNPASSTVTIQLPTCTAEAWRIDLIDLQGRRIRTTTSPCDDTSLRFDVSGVAPGSYIVYATANTTTLISALLMVQE